ncbi:MULTISPECIES: SRPBCC family protein [Streptomyces]|uniref:Cyclase n=1 Tax=Streptomyces rutgersensis TaxID=53451 RepID=A0ABX6RVY6_9ACTN|nr:MULTISPECIES: SRPBCC family protein [Streptomyces]NEE51763.1 SRPBCC family protein [Streptomyces sp. SID8455]WSU34720.1 SRPBCC family protein [Streptomyces gougerotii]MBL3803329.1 SRPBCC family protein [Streptomyces sp. BRB081]MDQ0292373.1 putative membrane protein [Streptomyces sp. DSM 41037]PJM84068.1 cyclase [Streptomyces sp. TSRI0384-2]
MTTVEESVEVAVDLRTAYDQWTRFEGFPRFMSVVKRVQQMTPGVSVWVIGTGPLRRELRAEILEQVPDSHLVWQGLDRRGLRHRGEVRFRSLGDDRTEVTLRMEVGGRALLGLFCGVPGAARRVVRRELGNFQRFIEGLGEAGEGWRGTIRNGHVRPGMPEISRSRVPTWPVG